MDGDLQYGTVYLSVPVFELVVIGWMVAAIPALLLSLAGVDPAGRFGDAGVGLRVDARRAWFYAEVVALVVFPASYFWAGNYHLVGTVAVVLWMAHFGHRAFVWPWLVLKRCATEPLTMCVSALLFHLVNGLLLSWFMFRRAWYPEDWVTGPRFVSGLVLMLGGAGLNVWADYRLRALRKADEGRPVMPSGGLFQVVACPNHLGEIVEWIGFALLTWSLPGLALAVWTVANLVPRALWRRDWYRERFSEYPKSRRAVLPGLL